jgi:DNA invertase Pin-like site-specific DNA recombinase
VGTPARAAIYCRISADRSGAGEGVGRQEAECRELAESLGWTVSAVLVDNDISAFSGRRRPAYEELLAGLKAGEFDGLIAWAPDRLHRRLGDLEQLIGLVENTGVEVRTVRSGRVDLSTASGRVQARLLGSVARYESEMKGERHQAKAREMAQAGKPNGGGLRPFGFKPGGLEVDEAEADLIREAVSDVLAGRSIISIVRSWNQTGVRTPTGRSWESHPCRSMLTRARLAGLREHKGVVVGPASWPAIISVEEHQMIQAVLQRRVTGGPRTPRKHLLGSGMLRCGLCGGFLQPKPSGQRPLSYACRFESGCGKVRVQARHVEDFITEAVFGVVDTSDFEEALEQEGGQDEPQDPRQVVLHEIQVLEQRRAELVTARYADGALTDAAYRVATARLDEHLRQAQAQLDALAPVFPMPRTAVEGGSLRAAWPTMTLQEQVDVLRSLLVKVVVQPAAHRGGKFDPTRLEVEWQV